jgi:hypothetical protein
LQQPFGQFVWSHEAGAVQPMQLTQPPDIEQFVQVLLTALSVQTPFARRPHESFAQLMTQELSAGQ